MIEPLLQDARARLTGVPRVPLGRLADPPRLLSAFVGTRIVPDGSVWPLGVLLLGVDQHGADGLWATGEVVRARPEDRRGYPAESARRRGELAVAASRGGFADGVAVQLPAMRIEVGALEHGHQRQHQHQPEAAGPLGFVDGVISVRWSPAAPLTPLAAYLDERIRLLLEPPERA